MAPPTFNRPIHERLYTCGTPEALAGRTLWAGCCEVDDAEEGYFHHLSWPQVDSRPVWLRFDRYGNTGVFEHLIANGQWVLATNPLLMVSEGL